MTNGYTARHVIRFPSAALSGLGVVLCLSGCAALMYEVVWFQLLQLVIGASSPSLALVLGTYMGGLGLGSLVVPRLVRRRWHPLRVLASLELVVALLALALEAGWTAVGAAYNAVGGSISMRLVVTGLWMLPPTIAMGATLPMAARAVAAEPRRTRTLGGLYAANVGGAVAGTLIAAFYLLRLFDVTVTTYAAAALNIAAAVGAWTLARVIPATASARPLSLFAPVDRAVLVTAGVSGATALAAEVIWTRLLSLYFGATVYAFALVLAIFLAAMAAGSSLAALVLRHRVALHPRAALGWCQLLLSAGLAWGAYVLTRVLPFAAPPIATENAWTTFGADVFVAGAVIMPSATLWGASFALALAASCEDNDDAGGAVGRLIAANTCGAIVGALGASALLSLGAGSQMIQQLLVGLSATAAMIMFMPTSGAIRPWHWVASGAAVLLLVPSVSPLPGAVIAFGRESGAWARTGQYADVGRILYAGEGVNQFIAVSRDATGALTYHAAGKVQASTLPEDMRLQLLLAHLSHFAARDAASVLVIGCGAGITAGALATAPNVTRMTVADVEPLAPQVASAFFSAYNERVFADPRVTVSIDDGRHLLATTKASYDIITTDLTDPWVKGVAALFTTEYFELARQHLRPGGIVTQFVQLYQSNPETVKTEVATFISAFPHALVWSNTHEGEGYDLVLMGSLEPFRIDVDAWQARLDQPGSALMRRSLARVGITSAVDLLSTLASTGEALLPWIAGVPLNQDRSLRLQYVAGLGLNVDESAGIYRGLIVHAAFPESVVTGSRATMDALRRAVADRRPK